MARICILGTGAWGTALATAFVRQGHDVRMWGRNPQTCEEISKTHRNHAYLGEACLPDGLSASTDMAGALENAEIVLFVAPAQSTGEVAGMAAPHLPGNALLIACAKGIDRRSGQTQSEVIDARLPDHVVGVLSGPSFAADVVRGLPTALTLALPDPASRNPWHRRFRAMQSGFMHPTTSSGCRSEGHSRMSWPSPSASAVAEEWGQAPKRR
jgi:glycerol-3-phosphate dehydrogenase (NAD(P)+)